MDNVCKSTDNFATVTAHLSEVQNALGTLPNFIGPAPGCTRNPPELERRRFFDRWNARGDREPYLREFGRPFQGRVRGWLPDDTAEFRIEQDVKCKEQESADSQKSASEQASDWNSSNAQLSGVVQHFAKLNDMCVAKAGRTAESAGLKEAYQFCLRVRPSKSSDAPSGWHPPALIACSCGRCPLLAQHLVKLELSQTDVSSLPSATFHVFPLSLERNGGLRRNSTFTPDGGVQDFCQHFKCGSGLLQRRS